MQVTGDIGNDVQSDALAQLYGIGGGSTGPFDTSLPAQPGPPVGIRPFGRGEASAPAYLAKLGAAIFQRARERAMYKQKLQQQGLADAYKRAQIDRLQQLTQAGEEPTYSVEIDGQKFSGLKGGEAARVVQAKQAADKSGGTITADPYTGKPLPAPMKVSEWLTFRGQNMTSERAAAARGLQEKLAGNREKDAKARLEIQQSTAALSGIKDPTEQELFARAGAAAQDSLARAGKKNPSPQRIKDLTGKMYPYVSRSVRDSLATRRDSLVRNIQSNSLLQDQLSPEAEQLIQAINANLNSPGP